MTNKIDSISDYNSGVFQLNDANNEIPPILTADHILLVKLSAEDRAQLLALFELKQAAQLKYNEFNERLDQIVEGKITTEDIDRLKQIFITNEDAENTYVKKLQLSQFINNDTEVKNIKLSVASIINNTNDLVERVDIIEDKINEMNITLKSSNW